MQDILDSFVDEIGIQEIEDSDLKSKRTRKYTPISVENYRKIRDWLDKRNKEIGNLAEQFVFENEFRKVKKMYPELIENVIWKSKYYDGLGYDIESISNDRSTKYIEVKGTSTNSNKVPFYITKNELLKAKELKEKYVLILVKNVGENKTPKIVKEIVDPYEYLLTFIEAIQYKGVYPN